MARAVVSAGGGVIDQANHTTIIDYRKLDSEIVFKPRIRQSPEYVDLPHGYVQSALTMPLLTNNWWYPWKTTYQVDMRVTYPDGSDLKLFWLYIKPDKETPPIINNIQTPLETGVNPDRVNYVYLRPTKSPEGYTEYRQREVWATWGFSMSKPSTPELTIFPVYKESQGVGCLVYLTLLATRMARSGRRYGEPVPISHSKLTISVSGDGELDVSSVDMGVGLGPFTLV